MGLLKRISKDFVLLAISGACRFVSIMVVKTVLHAHLMFTGNLNSKIQTIKKFIDCEGLQVEML